MILRVGNNDTANGPRGIVDETKEFLEITLFDRVDHCAMPEAVIPLMKNPLARMTACRRS
jgi:hypothetical protein